jgi:hypothetical protein
LLQAEEKMADIVFQYTRRRSKQNNHTKSSRLCATHEICAERRGRDPAKIPSHKCLISPTTACSASCILLHRVLPLFAQWRNNRRSHGFFQQCPTLTVSRRISLLLCFSLEHLDGDRLKFTYYLFFLPFGICLSIRDRSKLALFWRDPARLTGLLAKGLELSSFSD